MEGVSREQVADLGDLAEPFVSISVTISGNLPEDVVAALQGVLTLLREHL